MTIWEITKIFICATICLLCIYIMSTIIKVWLFNRKVVNVSIRNKINNQELIDFLKESIEKNDKDKK